MSESVGTASLQADLVEAARVRAQHGWLVLAVGLFASVVIAAAADVVDDDFTGFGLQLFSRCSLAVGCWWLASDARLSRGLGLALRVIGVGLVVGWLFVWSLDLDDSDVRRGILVHGTPFIVVDIAWWTLLAMAQSHLLRAKHPLVSTVLPPAMLLLSVLWAAPHFSNDLTAEIYGPTWEHLRASWHAETDDSSLPGPRALVPWLMQTGLVLACQWWPSVVCGACAVVIWRDLRRDDDTDDDVTP